MHEVIEVGEGVLGVAVDGPALVASYSGFPRTLETFVSHAGGPCPVLLEVSPLDTDAPGKPWREFEFVSGLLEGVEACAVVCADGDRDWVVGVAERLLPEAVVQAHGSRAAALDWLRA